MFSIVSKFRRALARRLRFSQPRRVLHHHPKVTTQTTRAINIIDIAFVIVSFIEDRQTLLALALTNRVLCEVALDALWAEGNLLQLARLMPSRLWTDNEVERIENGSNAFLSRTRILNFTNEPREGRWLGDRFSYYSKRVRVIHMRRRDGRRAVLEQSIWHNLIVRPSVILAWLQYAPVNVLFPRFTELRVDEVIFREGWILSHVIGPRLEAACALVHPGLKYIYIEVPHWLPYPPLSLAHDAGQPLSPSDPTILFQRVFTVASQLVELKLIGYGPPQEWLRHAGGAISTILRYTEQLRTLSIGGPIPAEDLLHVAQLPFLDDLYICGPIASDFLRLSETSHNLFPVLTELVVVDDVFSDTLSQAITSPYLKAITFRLRELPMLAALSRYMPTLSRHSHLEIIEIGRDPETLAPPRFRMDGHFGVADMLKPIINLPRLKIVSLASQDDFAPHDTQADSIMLSCAKSWPYIQKLILRTGNCRLSLSSFIHVLEHCPRLEILEVGVDCSTTAPACSTGLTQTLRFISVVGSPHKLEQVTGLLLAVCSGPITCRAHTSHTSEDRDAAQILDERMFKLQNRD